MRRVRVIGEDALCCALGSRLVAECLKTWIAPERPIDTKGVTKLTRSIGRYAELARNVHPVVCIADTDGKCPVELINAWFPGGRPPGLIVRLAVTEAESWLLADREGISRVLHIPENRIPHRPDEEDDPKRFLLSIARRSKNRIIQEEFVSRTDPLRQGLGYNVHLCEFAGRAWDPVRASERSPSLARAIDSLSVLDAWN